jgi:hypothetical protein
MKSMFSEVCEPTRLAPDVLCIGQSVWMPNCVNSGHIALATTAKAGPQPMLISRSLDCPPSCHVFAYLSHGLAPCPGMSGKRSAEYRPVDRPIRPADTGVSTRPTLHRANGTGTSRYTRCSGDS